jgi:NifU-like protein
MGQAALKKAIADYRGIQIMEKPGEMVCECFDVTDLEIIDAVRANGLETTEDVTNYLKAGGGCGNCIPELEAILKRVTDEMEAEKNKPKTRPMTNLQKIHLIEDVIDREIRPALRQDGGDLELIDVDGNIVKVRFRGACSGCAVSAVTLNDVVAARLRENVSDDLVIEEVK